MDDIKTDPSRLSARPLGQFLLLQSVVESLPDEPAMCDFVARGLTELPGVAEARVGIPAAEAIPADALRYPLQVGEARKGELWIRCHDRSAFQPYEDYLRNFCFMLAVILEERQQRRLNEEHQARLEQRVQERTRELEGANDALRESEARYRSLFENATTGLYRTTPGGHVEAANPTLLKMLGYASLNELQRRNLETEGFEPKYSRAQFRERIERDGEVRELEAVWTRKDGAMIFVRESARAVRDAGGRVVYYEGVVEDITERKRAEAEKEKLQAQLTQSQKMESVGQLAGGVAHDFNNMLQAILLNTALALQHSPPASRLREHLDEIRKAAQRSADLTRQLLAFARRQTIAPEVLDLNDAIEGMLKMLRRLIGEDIELAWLRGSDLGLVNVDPSQVDQILANLCVNARDAIGTAVGKVTIETANATCDEAYVAEHPEAQAGEYVRLAVGDNGCGMSPEVRAHLFEPFFTTKGPGEGTGLGLATVYGIVKQNQGFINVQSELGRGTTFQIHLPRYVARKAATAETASAPALGRGHETILLVEDEPAILWVGKRLLENLGYTVLATERPGEALQLAREHVGEIHLLITDVVMPEMNGRDLARNLLSQFPNLRRLFVSGYTANVIARHGVLDPGVHFLQKPYSIETLADKVREMLDETSWPRIFNSDADPLDDGGRGGSQ